MAEENDKWIMYGGKCENCGSKERVIVCNGCYHRQDVERSELVTMMLKMLYNSWLQEIEAGCTYMEFDEWLVAGWQLNRG